MFVLHIFSIKRLKHVKKISIHIRHYIHYSIPLNITSFGIQKIIMRIIRIKTVVLGELDLIFYLGRR